MFRQRIRILLITLQAMLIMACNEKNLLEHLTQQQANHVLAILQQHDISAEKQGGGKNGYAITVNREESTTALSIINLYQLPWPANVQIEQAFPESALVASPGAEQARVISLQEQRLEQSLRIIEQVVNAKVHISYPSFGNESNNKIMNEHVGVLITHKGNIDESIFISQIKSLIKNSLSNIRYENISVVLFPAPAIQYAPPTKLRVAESNLWQFILALALVVVLISGFIAITTMIRRKHFINSTTPSQVSDEDPPK